MNRVAAAMLCLALAPWFSARAEVYEKATGKQIVVTSPAGTPGDPTPTTGTPNQTTVTCGATNTTLLAPGAATQFVMVKSPAGAVVTWINFAGANAVAAPPSLDLAAGAAITWRLAGYLPNTQFNCIVAAGSQALTLIYK
jgi:hypothetical protein